MIGATSQLVKGSERASNVDDARCPEFMDLLRAAFPGQVAVKIPAAAKAIGLSDTGLRLLVRQGVLPSVLRPTTGNLRERPLIDLRQNSEA